MLVRPVERCKGGNCEVEVNKVRRQAYCLDIIWVASVESRKSSFCWFLLIISRQHFAIQEGFGNQFAVTVAEACTRKICDG